MMGILTDMKYYIIAVLIYASVIVIIIQHLFLYILAIFMSSWIIVYLVTPFFLDFIIIIFLIQPYELFVNFGD